MPEEEKEHRIEIEEEADEALSEAEEEIRRAAEESAPDEELAEAEAREAEKPEEAASRLVELNEKYVRLYAEFENYRKRVAKDKEDLANYVREELIYEILPSMDHLDIALKHAGDDASASGLRQGVEMTLRELQRTLEKFGLKPIEAKGKPFDPEFHHAISQVESAEVEDKTVIEELRKGYMFGDKVLRAAMVSVSRRPAGGAEGEGEKEAAEEAEHNTGTMKEED